MDSATGDLDHCVYFNYLLNEATEVGLSLIDWPSTQSEWLPVCQHSTRASVVLDLVIVVYLPIHGVDCRSIDSNVDYPPISDCGKV